jgi:hypothetical protein
LPKSILVEFGAALRKSRSLLCLHLSGNPGVDEELRHNIEERAHCAPRYKHNVIDVINKENVQRVVEGRLVNNKLQEGLKLRNIQELKNKQHNGNSNSIFENSKNKLIIERVIGHKIDIPGSG